MQIYKKEIESISISGIGVVQVSVLTMLEDDDGEHHKTFHQKVFTPNQDVSGQDPYVQAICQAAWTLEIVEKYQQHMERTSLESIIDQ